MNKNDVAPQPPMGWNSYDYYNTMVNEEQVRANAEYMAKNLKKFGWEYVVIDIQWSDPDAGARNAEGIQYIPFSRFCIDEGSIVMSDGSFFFRIKSSSFTQQVPEFRNEVGFFVFNGSFISDLMFVYEIQLGNISIQLSNILTYCHGDIFPFCLLRLADK